jgi:hypothetical protein
MFDADHPLIRRLLDKGFRIAGHVYINLRGVTCEVAAYNAERTLKGRSRRRDWAEALRDLAREVSLAMAGNGPAP